MAETVKNGKSELTGVVSMLEKEEAARIVEPVIKDVVNCIADKRYQDLSLYVVFQKDGGLTIEILKECIEGYLDLNKLPYIDRFDVPCVFRPCYEYRQLEIYIYNNGTGFAADYGLTTDGELNDLTLQMEFLLAESNKIEAFILDAHVL